MNKGIAIFKIIASLILIIVCLAILGSLISGNFRPLNFIIYGNDKNYSSSNEENISIDDINNINMNFGSEKVLISTTTSDEIRLVQSSTAPLDSDDLITISKDGNSLTLNKPINVSRFNIMNFRREKIELYIPEKYTESLDISLSSGSLSINNLKLKNLNVTLSSGSTQIEKIDAENIKLKLSSGNFVGNDITSSNISTNISSGNLKVSGDFSNITTETSSGNTNISSKTAPNSLNSEVTSGKTEIAIPDNDGFNLQYRKSSGSINSDFSLNGFDKANKSGNVKYKNGGNSYNLSVSSGTLKLKKL